MADWILGHCPEGGAAAIEKPHGPEVDALPERGIAVFALNPKQLDRFRHRFSPAGAKDDRRDALVPAGSLATDRKAFREAEAPPAGDRQAARTVAHGIATWSKKEPA